MSGTKEICVICAWRAACRKKFSISGRDMKCADFVRDLSLAGQEEKETDSGERKKKP